MKLSKLLITGLVFSIGLAGCSSGKKDWTGEGETLVFRPSMGNFAAAAGTYTKSGTTFLRDGGNDSLQIKVAQTTTSARVTIDKNEKIKDVYVDAIEVAQIGYDGESMPHYVEIGRYYAVQVSGKLLSTNTSGETTITTTDAHDHSTSAHGNLFTDGEGMTNEEKSAFQGVISANLTAAGVTEITVSNFKVFYANEEVARRFENAIKTKRERGTSYGMGTASFGDWKGQMNHYQNIMKGKTLSELNAWYASITKGATVAPADPGDLLIADANNANLVAVRSGASMSLNDNHGNIIGAVVEAFNNALNAKKA